LLVSGSVGILSNLSTLFLVASQNIHWVHTIDHEYNTSNQSVVSGYFHESKWNSSSEVFIADKSEILVESLAVFEYHCNDMKDIVHKIARIVITTCIN